MNRSITAALLSAALLCSCGGGSSEDAAIAPAAGTAVGVLSDAPVAGVQYLTSSGYSGVTGAGGTYNYNPGESVTFRIGAISLGTTLARGTVTPLDLAASAPNRENTTTNLLVLLQSLDADGDPSNGITINEATEAATSNANVDLTLAPAFFASNANSALIAVMNKAALPKTTPVTEADALAHFKEQFFKQLEGGWIGIDSEGVIAVRFDSRGKYIVGEFGETDEGGHSGTEVGQINWDPKTGKVTLVPGSMVYNGNGDWGLDDVNASAVFKFDGDKLVVKDGDGTEVAFNRVNNSVSSPIVGVWALGSANAVNTQTFTFLPNGTYIMADPVGNSSQPASRCSDGGVELGEYSFNPTTGAFAVPNAPSVDTNNCAGLWDAQAKTGISGGVRFSHDMASFVLEGATFYRVSK